MVSGRKSGVEGGEVGVASWWLKTHCSMLKIDMNDDN